MKEIIITSSILICAVLLMRLLFRSKVSRRLIYASWLLVALRLLIPVQLGHFSFSVLNQVENVTGIMDNVAKEPVSGASREEIYQDVLEDYVSSGQPVFIPEIQDKVDIALPDMSFDDIYDSLPEKGEDIILPEIKEEIEVKVQQSITVPTLGQIAKVIWILGMGAMAIWFAIINTLTYRKLKKAAEKVDIAGCAVPVKVSPLLSSPCLFGLLRPTVYLTYHCSKDDQIRRHVLTHELTHWKHKDHIWSLVRCVCLCVYWFNPLVWVAAFVSKRDCELACDEAVLQQLGESERLIYGKTLVDMVATNPTAANLLETATAMHETKKALKERVNHIVKRRKHFLICALCLVLVLSIVAGCSFTGKKDSTPTTAPSDPAGTTEPSGTTAPPETTVPPEPTLVEIFTDMLTAPGSWYNLALTSLYSTEKDIDLSRLFYNGFADETEPITDAEIAELKKHPLYNEAYDIFRLPQYKMNDVVKTYFGITLGETNGVGTENLIYLKSTDCYYALHTDYQEPEEITILSIEPYSGGKLIEYKKSSGQDEKPFLLIMAYDYANDKYIIKANYQPDYALGKFPEIPEVNTLVDKPTELAVDSLVSCIYETSHSWQPSWTQDEFYFNMRLPAIVPFCEGAISINEEISRIFSITLINARDQYYGTSYGYSKQQYDIDYQAWLSDNVLSILITKTFGGNRHEYETYSLDISTGKRLTTADLTQKYLGESFATFLFHASYNAKHYYKELNGKGMPYPHFNSMNINEYYMKELDLYIADGEPMLVCEISHASFFFTHSYRDLDRFNWATTEQEVYDSLWGRYLNSGSSAYYESLLYKIFCQEPELFVKMLSQQEESLRSANIERIPPWDQGDDYEPFMNTCRALIANTTDPAVKETAQALLDSAIASARPPITDPPPTEPDNPYNIEGSLPPIPFVPADNTIPENPTLEDIVFTHYDHTVSWDSRFTSERQTYSIKLPAIVPISEDAKAINQEIRDYYYIDLNLIRQSYEKGHTCTFNPITYQAYLNNNILSLVIYNGDAVNQTFNFDIATGKRLSNADLGKIFFDQSYAEFLYHITGTRYQKFKHSASANNEHESWYLNDIENNTLDISYYKPYVNENGILVMRWIDEYTGEPTILTIDQKAQCSTKVNSEKSAYRWLFSIDCGTYEYKYSCLLQDVFNAETDTFITQMASCQKSKQEDIADQIVQAVSSQEVEAFRSVCENILSTASDDKIKETTQTLLDALSAWVLRL